MFTFTEREILEGQLSRTRKVVLCAWCALIVVYTSMLALCICAIIYGFC